MLFSCIVALEIAVIAGISTYIIRAPSHDVYVSPISREDVTAMPSDDLDFFYDLAAEPKPVVPDWLPYEVEYLRNGDHLNDRFDYAIPKPHRTYRIITLGDSWGFGMHVSTRDNYSERLEDLLNGSLHDGTLACDGIDAFEVLNLGVGGYDMAYMFERLRQRGMKYEPDLVVPIIKPDEFVLINELFLPRLRAAYAAYEGNIDPHLEGTEAKNPKQDLSRMAEEKFRADFSSETLESHAAGALERLATFYQGPLLFFVYGSLSQSQEKILASYADHHPDVHRYDSRSMLSEDEQIPHDGHPNIKGHARFAQELYGFLISDRVIPCAS